jgi:hypothetical protein
MTTKEQIDFVKGLSDNIMGDIVRRIRMGRIPENWDGHELRCLLADLHEQSANMTHIRTKKRSKRAKDYHNTVIVHNLV